MAKWGEGDPRWIVEERADAKNVNNWHWSDKDATNWSIKTIKQLLQGSIIENDLYTCKIAEVSKCEGEANVHVRKGKLIYFYEWQITIDWEGIIKGSDNKTKFKGKVEVLNLSDEYTVDELETETSWTSSSDDGDLVGNFMKSFGVDFIKSKLREYLRQLKEEYAQDLILPTKNDANGKSTNTTQSGAALNKPTNKATSTPDEVKGPRDLSNRDLSITDEFFCTPDDLYRVFTTKELVQAFTRSEAIMDSVVGGTYSVFSGNITGIFDVLVPGKTIQMKWRKREWPENHYSLLTLEMNAFEGGTRLLLTQTNVPAYDLENTRNGWHTIFLSALKQTYGYGGRMF
uniref:Activator of 90 kDa heat shock protein ATPase homolog 1 n=2 Tax=Schistosoma japonicum TaxID=6182 RepID=C1LNY0_SCHJA|nr:Activator of 90 kDa heat shock protein ATPase homolog 1 [Schistosoma japonicum]CAX76403.1 Activator of 90 kDa heat shock protein ATPase homolog 1 [Schistosoma japonicum]CAX76408.1 Activator of 90 kDa heat shock protein ATPase homolog 1 [Schistosoma japonicum]